MKSIWIDSKILYIHIDNTKIADSFWMFKDKLNYYTNIVYTLDNRNYHKDLIEEILEIDILK